MLERYKHFWEERLTTGEQNKVYDLLLVIDGKCLHPHLFATLRARNPKIRVINYLYDTTRGNYHFQINTKFFDKVVTYDMFDSQTYGWEFMPIPWCKISHSTQTKYAFFAMGTYNPSRYSLFRLIDHVSEEHQLNSFVKLYTKKIKYFPIKYCANLILKQKHYLPFNVYYSRFITHSFIPKDIFQKAMLESEVIVDSIDPRQDGLTARCTWALGAGKKIITNNKSIKLYDFYTPNQILVVEDDAHTEATKSLVLDFMKSTYVMPTEIRNKIDKFRMDNWLTTLLK